MNLSKEIIIGDWAYAIDNDGTIYSRVYINAFGKICSDTEFHSVVRFEQLDKMILYYTALKEAFEPIMTIRDIID
jgi:hypothetical protein